MVGRGHPTQLSGVSFFFFLHSLEQFDRSKYTLLVLLAPKIAVRDGDYDDDAPDSKDVESAFD